MKIGIITPYKHFPGGVESVNQELCNIFNANGHAVTIVSSDLEYPVPRYIKVLVKLFGLPVITAYFFNKYFKNSFDLIICNGEFSFGITHPKKITLFHGCYYGYYKSLKPWLSMRQKVNLLRHALIQKFGSANGKVISVSLFVASFLNEQGIHVDKVINNGIDTWEFKNKIYSEKYSELIFIGGFNYFGKGFDILEKCATRLNRSIYCLTGNCHLSPGLISLPNIPRSKIPFLLSRYKVFIFPSRYEGCQMAPIEAMSCGLPVIISEVGIGKEISELCPEFVIHIHSFEEEVSNRLDVIMSDYDYYSSKAREIAVNYFDKKKFEKEWVSYISDM